MAYKTVEVDVDIDLEDFDDQELIEELESRGVVANLDNSEYDRDMLTKIWLHDREGRKDEAYALMREYVLEKMNKIV